MIPPPLSAPDALKGIDDLIRSDFEAFRNTCFNWLLISTGVVVIGLLFELPEIWLESVNATRGVLYSRKSQRHIPAWVKLVVSFGWLLIVIGVAGEFVADSFVSKADGFVQKFDEILLADAQRKTGLASERAARAFERAALTEREASEENERAAKAEQQATEENARAAKALEAAELARKNAEGFSLQIAQANERAANAEARAAQAELELARIKSPRSLTNVPELVATLKQFNGTEYTFSAVCQEEECLTFLKEIDGVLQRAGWKRTKPPRSFPAINVFGNEVDFAVPVSLRTGIVIEVNSSESADALGKLPVANLPPLVKAAVVLDLALFPNLTPPQDGEHKVGMQPGTSTAVQINVGKKP